MVAFQRELAHLSVRNLSVREYLRVTQRKDRAEIIRLGISTCLLGQKVRYDAGHKHDRFITDVLGEYFTFVPICPEVEVGMGSPREAVRLVGSIASPQRVGNKSGVDWTAQMNAYAESRVAKRDFSNLCGYILKKDSPSCGMMRVKVFNESGAAERKGVGLYAASLIRQHPQMPVEEEGRLNDPRLRENFIVRVFTFHRLQQLYKNQYSAGRLVVFHTQHKYLLMSHSVKHYKLLGQLVADVRKYAPGELREKYGQLLMEGLAVISTVKKNVNVLQHILGYLKKQLSAGEKKDIIQVIDDYHRGLVPLIVPITLVRHYVDKHNVEYIKEQIYLNPHPKELMLRNHV